MTDDKTDLPPDQKPQANDESGGPTSRVARRLLDERSAKSQNKTQQSDTTQEPSPEPTGHMDVYIPEIHGEPDQKPKKSPQPKQGKTEKNLLGFDLRRSIDADIEDELAEAFAEIESKGDLAAIGPAPPTGEQSQQQLALEPGSKITVTVVDVRGGDVFVDLGEKSEGFISVNQFEDKVPAKGDRIEIMVDGYDERNDAYNLRVPGQAQQADWGSVQKGMIVDASVKAVNKGGLEVTVNGLRGFMPAGQADIAHIEDLSSLVGKTLRSEIMEANLESRNLVVSRKKVLEREREEKARALRESIEVGQVFEGVVRKLMDFGAFVDIGGLDGLVHVSQLSWRKVRHPSEILREGENVKVKVLSYDRETDKLGLGLRQLHDNPWMLVAARFHPGTIVSGKVTRTADFGAFVELEPGIEGLIHISELSGRRVSRVTEVVREGDLVEVKVQEVDPERQRIALSLKAAAQEAAAEKEAEEAAAQDALPESEPPKPKKEFKNLKGGIGNTAGPLFQMPK